MRTRNDVSGTASNILYFPITFYLYGGSNHSFTINPTTSSINTAKNDTFTS